jgi:hypothetical protein
VAEGKGIISAETRMLNMTAVEESLAGFIFQDPSHRQLVIDINMECAGTSKFQNITPSSSTFPNS